MYTMKQACKELGMTYETLRFYCDEGLVPNVKRDKNNYRNFDERNMSWLKSLQCLKKCGMSIKDMKKYMYLYIQGVSAIGERKAMLNVQKEIILLQIKELQESLAFIDRKQKYCNDVLSGKTQYLSNLIDTDG